MGTRTCISDNSSSTYSYTTYVPVVDVLRPGSGQRFIDAHVVLGGPPVHDASAGFPEAPGDVTTSMMMPNTLSTRVTTTTPVGTTPGAAACAGTGEKLPLRFWYRITPAAG